jgi:hypothetical protein
MLRLARLFLFILAIAIGGLLEATPVLADADNADNADKVIAAKPDAPSAKAKAKAPTKGGPSDAKALWWDDPKIVKALTLTAEQRKKMSSYLESYRKNVPKDRKPEAFQETLVQGNWKDARVESAKLGKAAQTSVQLRGALKIDVLSLLSKKQRELLVDRYPRLIYKPWRRAMRGASPR